MKKATEFFKTIIVKSEYGFLLLYECSQMFGNFGAVSHIQGSRKLLKRHCVVSEDISSNAEVGFPADLSMTRLYIYIEL